MKNKLSIPTKKRNRKYPKLKPDKEQENNTLHTVRLLRDNGSAIPLLVNKIMIAIAEDHRVKVLVKLPDDCEWFYRNETLEKFLSVLPNDKFERINRFYILNWNFAPSYFNKTKTLTFNKDFSLELKHKIKLSVFKDKK